MSICTVVLAQEVESGPVDSSAFKPYVMFSVGGGVTRFMGDVQDASKKVNVHMIGNRAAYDLNVGIALSRSFVLNVNGIYGKLSGNENTFKQHRNFETQFALAGVNVEYNFAGCWKKRLPVLNPFITVGAYYSNYFNIATDQVNADGEQYYYWSNGRILDRPETDDHQLNQEAENMSRDYDYETSLIDGMVHSFTASAGFGLDLHISRALSVRLMSRYFHAVTDKVDGYYTNDISSFRDGYFFNELSLVFNTSAFSKKNRVEPIYKYLFDASQFESLENEDLDGDGVLDMNDRCAATPAGVEVDKHGCPVDNDEDGIADFKDIDPNTQKGEIVTTKGDIVDYELIESRWSNAEGARVISWDKKYPNPRYNKEESYTVAFSVTKGEKIDEQALLKKYPKLIKKELSDSLTVFNMGTFEKFENAQEASLRTHQQFTHDAVVVNSTAVTRVAEELSGVKLPDSIANRDSYGIAESIKKIKTTDAHTFPQLEYTISRFEGHLKNGIPESVLVEPYLRGIAPFTWNKTIKDSYVEVNEKLKENPVAKVSVVLASMEAEDQAESVAESQTVEKMDRAEEAPLMAEFKLSPNAKLEFMPTTEKFKVADMNEDGLIGYQEIERVLSDIVDGNGQMPVDDFNEMVVLFTDFTENVEPIDFGGTKAAYLDGKLIIFKPQNTELKKDARRLLAKKYKEADFNADGELTPDEVQKLITLFMEGKIDFPSEKVYELIDLYFE
ncbi:MAG: hypothetical protein H6601_10700 [Flavobacteriales bacterium]|nr:hypothetical protein [Flavobacteriales bacterium]